MSIKVFPVSLTGGHRLSWCMYARTEPDPVLVWLFLPRWGLIKLIPHSTFPVAHGANCTQTPKMDPVLPGIGMSNGMVMQFAEGACSVSLVQGLAQIPAWEKSSISSASLPAAGMGANAP